MRPLTAITLSYVLAGIAFNAAQAQSIPKLKPGAWEQTTITPAADSSAMREQMAKMPPQVREMMEKSMPKGPQTHVNKHCVSGNDEAFAQSMQSRMGANVKCDNVNMRPSGTTHSWTSRCAGTIGPNQTAFKSESEHQFTLTGDAYQHKMKMKNEGGPGGPTTSESTTNGRFLGADCKAHGALTMAEQMKQLDEVRSAKPRPGPAK